jgi:hypothetical protein
MASSSSEVRSTTENLPKGSPHPYIGDGGPWDEASSEEAGGGEDPIREGNGVEAWLDEDKGEDVLT